MVHTVHILEKFLCDKYFDIVIVNWFEYWLNVEREYTKINKEYGIPISVI